MTTAHAIPSATSAACEIWIRRAGSRRQALYRQVSTPSPGWRPLPMLWAERALREGQIKNGPLAGTRVVSRETDPTPQHPMAAGFATQAQSLNRQIDALNVAARAS